MERELSIHRDMPTLIQTGWNDHGLSARIFETL